MENSEISKPLQDAPVLKLGIRQWGKKRKKRKLTRISRAKRKRVRKKFMPYEEAKEFVQTMGIQSIGAYKTWYKLTDPLRLPARPDRAYKDSNFRWTEFLGTKNRFPTNGIWRSYLDAKMYASTLGIRNREGWFNYIKENKIPNDIPRSPEQTYKTQFKGWKDFLSLVKLDDPSTYKKFKVFFISKNPNTPDNVFIIDQYAKAPIDLLVENNRAGLTLLRAYYMTAGFDWKYEISKFCKKYKDSEIDSEYVCYNMNELIQHISSLATNFIYIENIKK